MENWNHFRGTDLLDIVVIAFLIYAVLIWFKQTSARFVIIGISILCIIYLVAKYLSLYLTTAIFQAFFAVFFLALVIIFQEELRHFFERLALWGTWRSRRKLGPMNPIIEVLIRTVANLSQKRVGALIVLRGQDPLDRHLEGGIPLHGTPSEQLLESIFDPHSSGHDGAVIIESDLVQKFGCHLPLSKDLSQIANYGTRHTAALGLAERCDALSVVVSEERGSIAITQEGRIHPVASLTQLNTLLEKFYAEKFPQKKSPVWLRWITEHFKEKVFAVTLAVAVWFVFGQRTESIRRDFTIPIEYRNLASTLFLQEPKAKEVSMTLSGLERAFDLLEPKSLKVSLDMSHIQPGEQTVIVRRQDVMVPANLTLERIEPSILKLLVNELIQLTVPVQPQITGALAPSLELKKVMVTPQEVSVIVTPEYREEAIKILTEPIDLSQVSETVTLSPKLVVPSDIRFPDEKMPGVKVTLEILKVEPPPKPPVQPSIEEMTPPAAPEENPPQSSPARKQKGIHGKTAPQTSALFKVQ